jgi:hypothetical protein
MSDQIVKAVKAAWRNGERDKEKLVTEGILSKAALSLDLGEAVRISTEAADTLLFPRRQDRHASCSHGRRRSRCSICLGTSKAGQPSRHGLHTVCEHGKRKTVCSVCRGGSICNHGKLRERCDDCRRARVGGGSLCRHGYRNSDGKECRRCRDEHNPKSGMPW